LTSPELPPLDCHAHIAPDVTASQLDGLGSALIFAVTRSLDEARFVAWQKLKILQERSSTY